MKNILSITLITIVALTIKAQTFSTNETPVGMEHNVLFNATSEFTVSQTGRAALILKRLFDGKFVPSYTSTQPSFADPTVVLIEGLPDMHSQQGAWVGWSTRGGHPNRFKIEAYNTYQNAEWRTVADYSNEDYSGGNNFNIKVPRGSYTKLRFTFYTSIANNGILGISELFFIHPEAVSPYQALLKSVLENQIEQNFIAVTTNVSPVGMEHNVLFNATSQFTVSQTGSAELLLDRLFDGKFVPSYTRTVPSFADPTVVLIEDLPDIHIQRGAWIGWSTRGGQPNRFKIEAYNTYQGEEWRTVADYSNNDYLGGSDFISELPKGSYTKLRFTFYTTGVLNGILGISELFYLHPEAVSPYEGLLKLALWQKENDNIVYNGGNVGIGCSPEANWKLSVNGKIRTKEVKVETGWADFVFEDDYILPTLSEVENHINEKGHLKDIPSADEVAENGINIGEIQAKLLQKIEELTLYTIQQEKLIKNQVEDIATFKNKIVEFEKFNTDFLKLKQD